MKPVQLVAASALAMIGLFALPSVAAARERPCTPERAERVTVRQVAADAKAFVGRCLTLTAVAFEHHLYDDVAGLYEASPDPSNATTALPFVGSRGHAPSRRYGRVTVTGVVGDCDCAHAVAAELSAGGEIVMIGGYCHTATGPYLEAQSLIRQGPVRWERRLSGPGDLAPPPPDWVDRAKIEATARRFATALQAGDKASLMQLALPDYDPNDSEDARGPEVRETLDALQGPAFARLRREGPASQHIILTTRGLAADETDRAVVCFCRENDCAGRWPIARFDADNLSSRPYACIETGDYVVFRKGTAPWIGVATARTGLVEPRR